MIAIFTDKLLVDESLLQVENKEINLIDCHCLMKIKINST